MFSSASIPSPTAQPAAGGSGAAAAIELRGVQKRFGDVDAVAGLDLVVPRGATYGLLGPNGAGKTTTIRMLLRILAPDAGEVHLLGEPLAQVLLDRVGYLPEERGLYRRMRVRRLLTFLAELKGISARVSAPRIGEWLERFGLADRAESRLEELSKGNQQKVQFIGALLHDPELLILDEPFSGLDIINQQVLKDVIADLKRRGRTIIFCTHMIREAERLCDHVCVLARGRKVIDGALSEVKARHAPGAVVLRLERWSADAIDWLRHSPLVARVHGEEGSEVEVMLRGGSDPQSLLEGAVGAGLRLTRFEVVAPSLEQIFLERVGAGAGERARAAVAHV